ncbi:hypothetical protein VNO77_22504 [Canavalia gladiata]|uniref:Uncharacterized protein n=1 Tax=Canavalia gladiata TaxID=3824 RepID=A0AAN9QB26_CANGL
MSIKMKMMIGIDGLQHNRQRLIDLPKLYLNDKLLLKSDSGNLQNQVDCRAGKDQAIVLRYVYIAASTYLRKPCCFPGHLQYSYM